MVYFKNFRIYKFVLMSPRKTELITELSEKILFLNEVLNIQYIYQLTIPICDKESLTPIFKLFTGKFHTSKNR